MSLTDEIKQRALALGFDLVGVTDASPIAPEDVQLFCDWLNAGCAAGMSYLHRNFEKRTNPAALLPNARSVIVVALNYKPPQTQSPPQSVATGRVAIYARYEDYHPFIKKRLRKLTDFIASVADEKPQFKICVDSAPLAERALAVRAGLGFIGSNRMLINPLLGPQLLLGELLTTLLLQPDRPITAQCPDCNRCIEACPTGALQPTGRFDARRCISYLTTEHKGQIPSGLIERAGDRLFGCDECVLACPFQSRATVCRNGDFRFYPDRARLDLRRILEMTEDEFATAFADSVLLRPGLSILKRNARACLAAIPK